LTFSSLNLILGIGVKKLMERKPKIEFPLPWLNDFCKRWKVKELSIFGSVLHDGFKPDSDVDVLVSFKDDAPWGLFEIIEMKEELEKVLGREVDLVEKEGIRNPFRRDHILSNHKVIYAA